LPSYTVKILRKLVIGGWQKLTSPDIQYRSGKCWSG